MFQAAYNTTGDLDKTIVRLQPRPKKRIIRTCHKHDCQVDRSTLKGDAHSHGVRPLVSRQQHVERGSEWGNDDLIVSSLCMFLATVRWKIKVRKNRQIHNHDRCENENSTTGNVWKIEVTLEKCDRQGQFVFHVDRNKSRKYGCISGARKRQMGRIKYLILLSKIVDLHAKKGDRWASNPVIIEEK